MNNNNLAQRNLIKEKISPFSMLLDSDSLSRMRSIHITVSKINEYSLVSSLQVVKDYRWHDIKELFDSKEDAIESAINLLRKHLNKNPDDFLEMNDWINDLTYQFDKNENIYMSID